jgi:hypothetical protein
MEINWETHGLLRFIRAGEMVERHQRVIKRDSMLDHSSGHEGSMRKDKRNKRRGR